MSKLPETGFLRIWHIIGDPKAEPPIPALIPVSRTSWLNGVKSGKYPKNIKLGERTIVWRVEDILDLIDRIGEVQHDWRQPKQPSDYFPFGGSFGISEQEQW